MTPQVYQITRRKKENVPGHFCVLHDLDSILGPWLLQFLPPWAGGGLMHERLLMSFPPPQVRVHDSNPLHSLYPPWMGQGNVLHNCTSVSGPRLEQSFPPCLGTGLLHCRVRVCLPTLHDLVHSVKFDHMLYPPSKGHGIK